MIEAPDISLAALAPLLFVFGAACVGVLIEAFWPRDTRHPVQVAVALVGTLGALVCTLLLAGVFLIAGLASLALPGTGSFVSEFLVLIGSFPERPVFTILATVGIILAALYILLMYQRTMHGPARGVLLSSGDDEPVTGHGGSTATLTAPRRTLRVLDLDRRELAVATPLVALIIALGVYPQPLLNLIEPAVAATMSDLGGSD